MTANISAEEKAIIDYVESDLTRPLGSKAGTITRIAVPLSNNQWINFD